MLVLLLSIHARVREIGSSLGVLRFDTTTFQTFATPPLDLPRSSNVSAFSLDADDAYALHGGDETVAFGSSLRNEPTCLKRISVGIHIHPNMLTRLTLEQAEAYARLVVRAASAIYEDHNVALLHVEYVDVPPLDALRSSHPVCMYWDPRPEAFNHPLNRHIRRRGLQADVYTIWSASNPCYSWARLGNVCGAFQTPNMKQITLNNVNGQGQGLGDVGRFAHELGHQIGLRHTFETFPACRSVSSCYDLQEGVKLTFNNESVDCANACASNRRLGCNTIMSYDAFCEATYGNDGVLAIPGWKHVLSFRQEHVEAMQRALARSRCECANASPDGSKLRTTLLAVACISVVGVVIVVAVMWCKWRLRISVVE